MDNTFWTDLLNDLKNLVAPLLALLKGILNIFIKLFSWLGDLLSSIGNQTP